MENSELVKIMDSDRWLINNGLISDSVKNQLFFCGSIVHPDVQAVELKITPEDKLVDYIIYVTPTLEKKIVKYKQLSTSKSLLSMWRFKRLLKKEGCLDFEKVLNSFVGEYCGPKWHAKASVLNFDSYVDSIEVANEGSGDSRPDKPADNR